MEHVTPVACEVAQRRSPRVRCERAVAQLRRQRLGALDESGALRQREHLREVTLGPLALIGRDCTSGDQLRLERAGALRGAVGVFASRACGVPLGRRLASQGFDLRDR